jgi:hypothetical protein
MITNDMRLVRSTITLSMAYWYEAEPHMAFPSLPPLHEECLASIQLKSQETHDNEH